MCIYIYIHIVFSLNYNKINDMYIKKSYNEKL